METSIRLSYPLDGEAPYTVRYKGHTYSPRAGEERDTLVFDAGSNLPLIAKSTNTVTLTGSLQITIQHRQTTYDYVSIPAIDPATPACG